MNLFNFLKNKQRRKNSKIVSQCNFCLLDTNFVSEFLKVSTDNDLRSVDPDFGKKMIGRFISPESNNAVFPAQVVGEIKKNKGVYKEFLRVFSFFPAFILKNFGDIISHEVRSGKMEKEDLVMFLSSSSGGMTISDLMERDEVKGWFTSGMVGADDFKLKRFMEEVKKNFKNGNSSVERMLESCKNDVAVRQGVSVDLITPDRCPGLFCFWYNILFKIQNAPDNYGDRSLSDIKDVIILSVFLPYVQKVFTDRSQKEFVEQMQKKGLVPKDLKVYMLSDVRNSKDV